MITMPEDAIIEYYKEIGVKETPPPKYDGEIVQVDAKEADTIERHYLDKLPKSIGAGSRFTTARSYAALLRGCGEREDFIKKKVHALNTKRFDPVKTDAEVDADIDRFIGWVMSLPLGVRSRKKSPIEVVEYTEDILKEAKEIYESGRFIQYARDAYRKIWFKDRFVLDSLMLSVAIGRIQQSDNGLHIFLSGKTQSGKTQAVKKAMRFIHSRNKMIKSFSMKYLFYAPEDDLKENTLVFSDDTQFNEEEAKFFRGILTSWDTGSKRGTVINGESKDLSIPPRVSLILTNIDSVCGNTDDGQDESRFFNLEIRRTDEDIKTIMQLRQEDPVNIDHEIDVVMAIWELIPHSVSVTRHRKISSDLTLREFNRYIELVSGHALLCGRTVTNEDDFKEIEMLLSNTIAMVDSDTAGFTRNECAVIEVLNDCKPHDVNEIAKRAKMKLTGVYKAVHGKHGTFKNPSGGIMSKIKGTFEHIVERSDFENDRNIFRLGSPINLNKISF